MQLQQVVENTMTFPAERWRYFVNTCWVSLTAGFLISFFAWFLEIPYGWAALLLFVRAAFWALILDIENLSVTVSNLDVTGPGLIPTSPPKTLPINRLSKVSYIGARFFLEGSDGGTISARWHWYPPDVRQELGNQIDNLRRLLVFSTSD